MFLDDSAFDVDEVDNGFSNVKLSAPKGGNSTLNIQDVEGDEDGGFGSAGNLAPQSSSRARMLAQQREIQLKRRQSSMQNAGMVRSSHDSNNNDSPHNRSGNNQFTPAMPQFSAPKTNTNVNRSPKGENERNSEFNRPARPNVGYSGNSNGRPNSRYNKKEVLEDEDDDDRYNDRNRNKNKNYDDYDDDDRYYNKNKQKNRDDRGNSRRKNKDYDDDNDEYDDRRGNRDYNKGNRNNRYDDDDYNYNRDKDNRKNKNKYDDDYDDYDYRKNKDSNRHRNDRDDDYDRRDYDKRDRDYDKRDYDRRDDRRDRDYDRNDRNDRNDWDRNDKNRYRNEDRGNDKDQYNHRDDRNKPDEDVETRPNSNSPTRNENNGNQSPTPVIATGINLTNMRAFLTTPAPRGSGIVQCYIRRNKNGVNKLHPIYTLYLKEGDRMLLQSKKRANNKTSNYIITMTEKDFNRSSINYLGKLRSNFVGTEFQVYDNGVAPRDGKEEEEQTGGVNTNPRKELAGIMYAPNVMGSRGPRKMQVAVPAVDAHDRAVTWKSSGSSGVDELINRIRDRNMRDIVYMINKPPRWNEQVSAYVLNFNGRVTMASVKNFQLVDPDNQEAVLLQFGRVGKDEFTMDFQWPLSPLQAFGITLSSFDSKIACD
eukprot:TRINITY_DN65658_c11_g2_i1.p1 TRINITY_DN65658_c11_g2~~TRINITY_DN65658_c11_g2_i1.p1  ORF type:complete len:648 (+),score=2.35 TRINITY_DN65658_c11_g2_i1:28-1971(+)